METIEFEYVAIVTVMVRGKGDPEGGIEFAKEVTEFLAYDHDEEDYSVELQHGYLDPNWEDEDE